MTLAADKFEHLIVCLHVHAHPFFDEQDGVGVDLAEATLSTLAEGYDVVMWEKHGVLAVDNDIIDAFDQVDVLNKAAQIYIAGRNMGFEPEGMSDAQLRELTVTFGLPK